MEPLTGLWADLKKTGGLPSKGGMLLTNCEAELTQLMKQIDVMVHTKRAEWQQEMQVLQAKHDVREQEYNINKSTLDQKHQEIGQLRCKVDALEHDKTEIVDQYERQLKILKDEVGTMRKEYEKLKKQYRRYAHQEKNRASASVEESSSELRKLSKKLDEYRSKAKDWDQQRRSYEKQVEALESQRKTLADKCELIQHQTVGYQSQLDRRRDMLDSTESSLRGQITQLEGQLGRTRDTISAQESQLTHLKTTLEDSVSSQRRSLEEKEGVEEMMRKIQAKNRQLETDLSRCQSELEARNAQVQATDSVSKELTKERELLERAIHERDVVIQRLKCIHKKGENKIICRLRGEVEVLLDEHKKTRKSERHLREEVNELREKLDASRADCENLNQQVASKIREIRILDGQSLTIFRQRKEQLEEKLSHMKESHRIETGALQKEIEELSTDLQHHRQALTSLSDKSAVLEHQLQEKEETIERKAAEIQVANAQLDALRMESRHLRRTALRSASSTTEEAESHLKDLQTAYTSSLKALEQQNESLQEELKLLRQEVKRLRGDDSSIDKMDEPERRELEESKEKAEKMAAIIQQKLDSTVGKYNAQISQYKAEIETLQDDLEFRNKTLKRLGMEHDAMTTFVGGVEDVVQQPPRREMSVLLNVSQHSSSPLHMQPTREDDEDEEELLDSVDVVTERFLSQQEERTRDLERKLDMHIENLKVNMDASGRKTHTER